MTDAKCIVKSDYIRNVSCPLDRSDPTSARLSVLGELLKELRTLRVDFSIDLVRDNGVAVTLFKERVDGCTFVYSNITFPLLRMYRDIFLSYGEWPRSCPIPAVS